MAYSAEFLPEQEFKDLLNDNWVEYRDTPKPDIIVANDPDNEISRFDLENGDAIIIKPDSEQIRYRGNISYYDRIQGLTVSIYTKESRQRLKDLYKMVRAICFTKKHDMTNWQLIRILSYTEMISDSLNIWKGEIRLNLENNAILCETSV